MARFFVDFFFLYPQTHCEYPFWLIQHERFFFDTLRFVTRMGARVHKKSLKNVQKNNLKHTQRK